MQDLNITLVQADLIWENPEKNKAQFESYFESIDTTDLIVLPEMFTTGFTMNAESVAETMDGPSIAWMKAQAKEKQCAIIGSIVIEENGGYYNRMVFVDQEGHLEYYDKMHLFSLAKEDQHYTPGKEIKIIELKGWKIMLQICFDLRFHTPFSNVIKDDQFKYDILINVANWPEVRSLHWKSLLLSRAIENQSFVIGLNRVGVDQKEFNYSGDSAAINLEGEYLLSAPPNQSGVYSVSMNKEKLKEARKKLPFLKDKNV